MKPKHFNNLEAFYLLILSICAVKSLVFHNPGMCLNSNERKTQCLISHLEDSNDTYLSLEAMIPSDTRFLDIYCTTQNKCVLTGETFLKLMNSLQRLAFWNCRFPYLPSEKLESLSNLRSLAFHIPSFVSGEIHGELFATQTNSSPVACLISNLTDLTFQNCGMQDIVPVLRCSTSGCCGNLLTLNFSSNYITVITLGTFDGLEKLYSLDLSQNSITFISDNEIRKLKSLKRLVLSANPLTKISAQMFLHNEELSELSIGCKPAHVMQTAPEELKVYHYMIQPDSTSPSELELADLKHLKKLKSLKSLILCLRYVNSTDEEFFGSMSRLSKLSLEVIPKIMNIYTHSGDVTVNEELFPNNNITELTLELEGPIYHSLFHNLGNLQTLNLIYCGSRVNGTNANIFNDLHQLRVLNIECLGKSRSIFKREVISLRELSHLHVLSLKHTWEIILSDLYNITHLKTISVEGTDLKAIPSWICNRINSSNLRELYLRNNYLSDLNHFDFQYCYNLVLIDLSGNFLLSLCEKYPNGTFECGIFRSFHKLSELYLSGNFFQFFDLSMIPESLQHLDLSFNDIKYFSDTESIRQELKLKSLILKENRLLSFSQSVFPASLNQLISTTKNSEGRIQVDLSGFAEMRYLEILAIGASGGFDINTSKRPVYNKTRYFDIFYEEENQYAKDQINSSQFRCYERVSLNKIGKFRVIPYYDNEISQHLYCQYKVEDGYLKNKQNSGYCRTLPNIQGFSLNLLDCSEVGFQCFPANFPSDISIDKLFLDGNNFTSIPAKAFSKLGSLTVLFLNNSHISSVNETVFLSKNKLRELHLENNEIEVSLIFLAPLVGLQSLYLQNNRIVAVHQEQFLGPPDHFPFRFRDLTIIDLSDNLISSIEAEVFYRIRFTPNIDFGRNRIRKLNGSEFIGLSKLTTLHLNNNYLEHIASTTFTPLKQLLKLYLNHNLLQELSGEVFGGLVNLQILNLANNDLNQIHVSTFDSLTQLTELNLSNNAITLLDNNLFYNLTGLVLLDLSYNKILNTYDEFNNLLHLQKMYLNNNLLITLNTSSFKNVNTLTELHLQNNKLVQAQVWKLPNSLQHLHIKNNPLKCDCDFTPHFQNWFSSEGYDILVDAKLLNCTDDKKISKILNYDVSVCRISYELILGTCAGFLFLLMLTVGACYYWRVEVQVWVYARYGMRIFYRNQDDDDTKVYDVFICYSSEDEDFVVNNLLPELKDYRICIHFKDFMPGAYINDNIIDAVEKSSRTLLVFSPRFIQSPWCKFEFKTAHHKSLEDRCCRLILLLYEDVDVNDMEPEQKAYLSTNTYLRWDDRMFWEKLRFALPNVRPGPAEQQVLLLTQRI